MFQIYEKNEIFARVPRTNKNLVLLLCKRKNGLNIIRDDAVAWANRMINA